MYRKLKAPMNIQFEITSICNERCLHCYNYWRSASDLADNTNMTKEIFDKCLNEIIENQVLHVIFTGGEPFFNFDVLLHGIKRATKAKLSVSCNSNLLIANDEKLHLLKEAGLPHILTSLNSYNPETNDKIVSHKGSFEKATKGISLAINTGIKISTNMIISKYNINDIYETGKLSYKLGVSKFHVTRVIPPKYITGKSKKNFTIGMNELKIILDQIVRIRKDFPIDVQTLIPIPLCALGDLNKYSNMVIRSCAAGKRSMSIDCHGNAHACWHMVKSYRNIIQSGLKKAWDDMQEWRSGELIPESCLNCSYLPLCGSGCRLSGMEFNGTISGPDNLRKGWKNITQPYSGYIGVDDMNVSFDKILYLYKESLTSDLYQSLKNDKYYVNKNIRIRQENGFGVINLIAGTSFFLEQKYVDLIYSLQKIKYFNLHDIGSEFINILAYFVLKKVIIKDNNNYHNKS